MRTITLFIFALLLLSCSKEKAPEVETLDNISQGIIGRWESVKWTSDQCYSLVNYTFNQDKTWEMYARQNCIGAKYEVKGTYSVDQESKKITLIHEDHPTPTTLTLTYLSNKRIISDQFEGNRVANKQD